MLSHMLHKSMYILKEPYVTELIYLIMAYGLHSHLSLYVLKVIKTGSKGCYT